jgi:hypothetical protein
MCEEFSCVPTEAVREWRRAPDGLIVQVMEARAFAATWRMYDAAEKKTDLPASPMLDLVIEIEMAERQRQLMERQQDG